MQNQEVDEIIVHVYNSGAKSLGLELSGGSEVRIGMLVTGLHDFGTADRKETITVVGGNGTINGVKVRFDSCITIKPGQKVVVVVETEFLAYKCEYPNQAKEKTI